MESDHSGIVVRHEEGHVKLVISRSVAPDQFIINVLS